ncbi:MAG: single-stranded DNA-binding protein [Ignavibacteria bacterium]|nr:single-stranded DNA-binding protein [Ignavibacteria bacterium]
MPFSLNKVIIIGRVGTDIEPRRTPQGKTILRFNVATTERYRDKSGTWQDITEWHKVVAFDQIAETASKLLKKGSRVCVEGRNSTRQYEKNGVTHYITEIIARSIVYLDPKPESQPFETTLSDNFSDATSYYISDIQNDSLAESYPETSDDDDIPF